MPKILKKSLPVIIIVVAVGIYLLARQATNNDSEVQDAKTTGISKSSSFDFRKLSISKPSSLWVIVNKKRPLDPKAYQPSNLTVPSVPLRSAKTAEEMQLRRPAADALEDLANAAKKDNVNLLLASGYRSYNLQTLVYNRNVRNDGRASADTQSARPGHSEHQTGLAADVGGTNRKCELQACFGDTKEGKWVAKNAHKFGFIIRYQEGQQGIVGYIYEPWHLRFVGKGLAKEVNKQGGIPLEKLFGLSSASDY